MWVQLTFRKVPPQNGSCPILSNSFYVREVCQAFGKEQYCETVCLYHLQLRYQGSQKFVGDTDTGGTVS